MNTTIPGFTQAASQAQQWVNELAADLGWDERRAYRLMRSVLHTLRDWLQPDEMADLSAQLPLLVRGIFFEGWQAGRSPATDRSKDNFISRVWIDLAHEENLGSPDRAITMVFRLLERHLDEGELRQVRSTMKKGLRQLWPVH
jgi:uncharacterized protein (DUF2267 family)